METCMIVRLMFLMFRFKTSFEVWKPTEYTHIGEGKWGFKTSFEVWKLDIAPCVLNFSRGFKTSFEVWKLLAISLFVVCSFDLKLPLRYGVIA